MPDDQFPRRERDGQAGRGGQGSGPSRGGSRPDRAGGPGTPWRRRPRRGGRRGTPVQVVAVAAALGGRPTAVAGVTRQPGRVGTRHGEGVTAAPGRQERRKNEAAPA